MNGFGKIKKPMFVGLFPIDNEKSSRILIWAQSDDSIVKYLANKSTLGTLLGMKSNLPHCVTIEFDSSNTELKIDIGNKTNNDDTYLLIKNTESNKTLFDAWCPVENRNEINDWLDAFST